MKKTFVIATVASRVGGLLNLLISAKRYIGEWKCNIIAQGYTEEQKEFLSSSLSRLLGMKKLDIKITYIPELIGCFNAKMKAIEVDSDLYMVLEDDMVLVPETDYDLTVQRYLENRDLGIMITHYCRKRELVSGSVMKDYIKRQALVGTGGGMLFDREIRDCLLRELTGHDYLFDDLAWSMCAYINGYKQGIFYGSIAVHQYGQQGGFLEWFKIGDHELPDESLIEVRKRSNARDNNNAVVRMGSEDLKPKAHELYQQNRRMRNEVGL